jgi:hypothetical protein
MTSAGGGNVSVRFCEVSTWTIFEVHRRTLDSLYVTCVSDPQSVGNFHCLLDLMLTGSGQVSQGSASGQPHSEEGKSVKRARW